MTKEKFNRKLRETIKSTENKWGGACVSFGKNYIICSHASKDAADYCRKNLLKVLRTLWVE